VAGGHSDTQNGRGESVRLKQLSVFRWSVNPVDATTLKKWRGEESPSVLRRRGCQKSRVCYATLTHQKLFFVVRYGNI